ncbi:MAG TPA: hypothetical protein VER39_04105 [Nocardioidaceae bacterium]|nr:hypothetical protein [Nocardioidaceae bacterium]
MRSLLAGVLLLLGALLVPVSTAGWWLRETIVPVDGYLEAVTPLAGNDEVRTAVVDEVVEQTEATVGDQLPGVVAEQLRPLVRAATARVVEDPAFVSGWQAANRDLHAQVVGLLSDGSAPDRSGADVVEIRLDTLTDGVRDELVDSGVPFADQLPATDATLPLGSTADLEQARGAYSLLERWGPVLPVAAVALLVAGLALARRRGAALAGTAVLTLVGLGVAGAALVLGRVAYLERLPSGIPRPAASAVFDTVTAGLRQDLLVVAVVALVALVVGLLTSRLGRR